MGGRPTLRGLVAGTIAVAVAIGLAWLGTWQLDRRAWKLDLIARVERRLAAAPVAAPGPEAWPRVRRADDEYRRVAVTGRYVAGRDTLVSASTVLGPGFWLVTPLQEARGFVVLVNRGFVPAEHAAGALPRGVVTVTGLLRMSEPGGDLLRGNDAAAGRWYSRDVAAIGRARRLARLAPYFIDAAAGGPTPEYPRGGLTVVTFSNNHLAYALTWYALAAMVLGLAWCGLAGGHARGGTPRG